jgi:hypothetical protein
MLPHERFVRYLITCGRDLPEVNKSLANLSLAGIDKTQYARIYKELTANAPKEAKQHWADPTKVKEPKGYVKLMRDLDLEEAYAGSATFKAMLSFAENEPFALAVQALFVKNTELMEMAAVLVAKFQLQCEQTHLKLYRSYLFDVPTVTKEDWRQYFSLAGPQLRSHLIDCFKLDAEALKTMHGLPSKVSYVSSLQEMHMLAMTRFREYAKDRGPESDKNARMWASLAMSSGSQFEKYRTKDLTDFSKEVAMEFEYVENKFPSVEELNG